MKRELISEMTTAPLIDKTKLYYLASPYSKYYAGLHSAFVDISAIAGRLLEKGVFTYSPIAHSHPIALYGVLDPYDHDIWMPLDLKIAASCDGLIVATMKGFEESKGVAMEIQHFTEKGLPVFFYNPDKPDELYSPKESFAYAIK
jgi:hypothetical protein